MSETKQSTGNFMVTKALIEGYHKQGLTVEEMATKITEASKIKCSVGVVRKAASKYGISLRNKPKKSPFVFEEPVATSPETPEPQTAPTTEGPIN